MTDLKPCPFCGPQPEITLPYVDALDVRCGNCHAHEGFIEWQEAWAHKRIAELEAALSAKEAEFDRAINAWAERELERG